MLLLRVNLFAKLFLVCCPPPRACKRIKNGKNFSSCEYDFFFLLVLDLFRRGRVSIFLFVLRAAHTFSYKNSAVLSRTCVNLRSCSNSSGGGSSSSRSNGVKFLICCCCIVQARETSSSSSTWASPVCLVLELMHKVEAAARRRQRAWHIWTCVVECVCVCVWLLENNATVYLFLFFFNREREGVE